MGRTGTGFSAMAIAAGAVLCWTMTTQGHGFGLSTVGVIPMLSTVGVMLMAIGGAGLVASRIVFGMSRSPAVSRGRTYDREMTDEQGRSTAVREYVH